MILNLDKKSEEPKCTGAIYKADVQHCRTKRGVMFSVRLNKLKRLSCPGCQRCDALEDELGEIDPVHWPIIGIENVKPGRLYMIRVANAYEDWESGIIDGWDLKVEEVQGPEKQKPPKTCALEG